MRYLFALEQLSSCEHADEMLIFHEHTVSSDNFESCVM